ncbi:MAG: phosphoenolpyruvate carboxykinase domain-containing protein, partial [Gammaproteobacteria bacterium]
PGFGENSRVLKWVFERCEGTADAIETPIGNLPTLNAIDFSGLNVNDNDKALLLRVDVDGWLKEIPMIIEYYDKFGSHLPRELREEIKSLEQRLLKAKQAAA